VHRSIPTWVLQIATTTDPSGTLPGLLDSPEREQYHETPINFRILYQNPKINGSRPPHRTGKP